MTIQHGNELTALIAERGGEEPTLVAQGVSPSGGDGFTLFRFADGVEVIETNAGLVTEDANEDFVSLKHCCTEPANALLAYAESEIVRLGLGDSATNCHGVAAYEAARGAVRLSDGTGLNVVCHTTDDVDTELEAMADFYAESK